MSNLPLALQVQTRNEANAFANELGGIFTEFFKPYVGEKIIKADGNLIAKIVKTIPALGKPGIRWRFDFSRYSVGVTLDVMHTHNGITNYINASFLLLDITEGTLVKVYEFEPLKADYSAEFVNEKLAELKRAEEVLRNIRRELGPFAPPSRHIG